MSDCPPCQDPSCACPLPACATNLVIGSITAFNATVFVHIVKANGSQFIHSVTSGPAGEIIIPLYEPREAFYNEHDGEYRMFVMLGGYFCDDDKLTVTTGSSTWTTVAFLFRDAQGIYGPVNLEIST